MPVGLLDIESAPKVVRVNGSDVSVSGVPYDGVLYLFVRFPELQRMFTGGMPTFDQIKEASGDCIAAIIACGCGYVRNDKAEAVARSLSVNIQLELVTEILKLTMPDGPGPFADKVANLFAVFGGTAAANDAPVKVRARKSPAPLNGSRAEDASAEMQPGA